MRQEVAACCKLEPGQVSIKATTEEKLGFTGREVKRVESMLKELDKLERRTDKLAVNLRSKLFKLESELPPVDVMFYYRVLALMGTLADSAETVGDRLQIPINHFEGNYTCSPEVLAELEASDRVVLRYVDNPNGSMGDIAGS